MMVPVAALRKMYMKPISDAKNSMKYYYRRN